MSALSFGRAGFDFYCLFTGLNRGEGARDVVVCYAVTLPHSVTLGTSSPDIHVSAWVLWCPILFSGLTFSTLLQLTG